MSKPDDIKAVNVLLSAELHARVKAMAALRGNVPIAEAYTEALSEWVDKDVPRELPPGVNQEILKAFVRFLTSPKSPSDEQHVLYLMMVLRERYGLAPSVTLQQKIDSRSL
jgi:hypothetical protein